MRRSIFAVALLVSGALACGGSYPDGDCYVGLSVSDSQPEAGTSVVATATVDGSGFQTFEWSVARSDGTAVSFSAQNPEESSISFLVAEPGSYDVTVDAFVDGLSCGSDQAVVNAQEPGSDLAMVRLRAVPRPEQAPPQGWTLSIPYGAEFDLQVLSLEPGIATSGVVRGPDGDPLQAYLRIETAGARNLLEAFTGADGAYDLRLPDEALDLLVVPADETLAPLRLSGVTAAGLDGTIAVPAGDSVTGSVQDGGPLQGASVALAIEGVPSTAGTSDAGGDFSLSARAGASLSLTVVPPQGSGLPRLEGSDLAASVAGGTDLQIAYAGDLDTRSVQLDVLGAGGAPLPGARVTFIARPIAGAGTVTVNGGSALELSGAMRASAEADGSGQAGPVLLPHAVYDVVVEPPAGSGETPLLAAVDLGAGAPAELALPAPATIEGTLLRAGEAAEGVRVSASGAGPLAASAAAGASDMTDETGLFSLEVVPGADYTIVFSGRDGLRHRVEVTAPAAGQTYLLGEISLPPTEPIAGELSIPGSGSAAGVHLTLGCADCPPAEAAVPMAEAISGPGGEFVLGLPQEVP